MSLRLTTGDYLQSTTGLLNYNIPYTRMAWIYPVVTPSGWAHIFSIAYLAGFSDYDHVGFYTGSTDLRAEVSVGAAQTDVTGTTIAIGKWWHISMVRFSSTQLHVYLNGKLDIVVSRDVAGRTPPDRTQVNAISGQYLANNRYYAMKEWQSALSPAEIKLEMQSVAPVKKNASGFYPFRYPGDYSNLIGKGVFTVGAGTPTREADPPIPWTAKPNTKQIPGFNENDRFYSIGGS